MCRDSTNGCLALVWVDEGLRQGLIDMGGRVGASSVSMEQFMHLGEWLRTRMNKKKKVQE